MKQAEAMAPAPDPEWAELEKLLPVDLNNEGAWQEGSDPKGTMPGGTIDWHPPEVGALPRLPDESVGPLPILANAAALAYSTPGELAALGRTPRRITFFSIGETYGEDFDVDGRRIAPPRVPHPTGLMDAAGSSASVSEATPGPLTAELAPTQGNPEAEFFASLGV